MDEPHSELLQQQVDGLLLHGLHELVQIWAPARRQPLKAHAVGLKQQQQVLTGDAKRHGHGQAAKVEVDCAELVIGQRGQHRQLVVGIATCMGVTHIWLLPGNWVEALLPAAAPE